MRICRLERTAALDPCYSANREDSPIMAGRSLALAALLFLTAVLGGAAIGMHFVPRDPARRTARRGSSSTAAWSTSRAERSTSSFESPSTLTRVVGEYATIVERSFSQGGSCGPERCLLRGRDPRPPDGAGLGRLRGCAAPGPRENPPMDRRGVGVGLLMFKALDSGNSGNE